MKEMGVTETNIQTVKDIYRLVRTAVVSRRRIRAIYHGRERWFCPHKLGRNREERTRVLCYQYRGRAAAGYKLQALRQTGGVSSWRNLAE